VNLALGWSKLRHKSTSEEGFSTMARFPVFKRTTLVVFIPVLVILLAMLVGPALEIFSCLVDFGASDWYLPIDELVADGESLSG
jgi:hypothetical protein